MPYLIKPFCGALVFSAGSFVLLAAGGCGCTMPWDDKTYPNCCDGTYAEVQVAGELIEVRSSKGNEYCDAGVRHMRNDDWDDALAQLKRAVQAEPDDDCAHYALGVAYEKTGDPERALTHYKRANYLRDFPLYTEAFRRLKEKVGQ